MFFNRKNIRRILEGKKTATRRKTGRWRLGNHSIRTTLFEKGLARIEIFRKYQQKLGDMTEEDARKEGVNSLEEFKQLWISLYGSWNPEEVVWVYEFKLIPGSIRIPPGHCRLCGSARLIGHYGISELAFSECLDCGAIYSSQGDLCSPSPFCYNSQ
ncbi:MAG: ASCH domain-containing protein [Candidatus Hecatellaceae archaeon]|nr:MAG: hypothetical protein DRO46_05115 [Candidatus Hecatellales archaeon]